MIVSLIPCKPNGKGKNPTENHWHLCRKGLKGLYRALQYSFYKLRSIKHKMHKKLQGIMNADVQVFLGKLGLGSRKVFKYCRPYVFVIRDNSP